MLPRIAVFTIVTPFMDQTPTLPLLSHQIMFMQAVEPTDSANGPGRHVAEGQSRRDCGVVHQPDADIATIVAPENVGIVIVVEVALPDHRPAVGTLLGSTLLCEIDEPFIGHIPTLPLASRQSTLLSRRHCCCASGLRCTPAAGSVV
jgi:hypothetical protein